MDDSNFFLLILGLEVSLILGMIAPGGMLCTFSISKRHALSGIVWPSRPELRWLSL